MPPFGYFRAVPKVTRPQAKPRRRKVCFASFPPKDGENFTRFLAPPLPTEPASLGFGGGPERGLAGTLRQKKSKKKRRPWAAFLY